jgi:dipeptidase E
MSRLLLISTSTTFGTGYLDHAAGEIPSFLDDRRDVLFVPYALHDLDAYEAKAKERYSQMGLRLRSIHREADPRAAVESAAAIFIGGGNTFRLLNRLYAEELIEPIRRKVAGGMPYIGTSAGSNVACVTIKTTNDMPIVHPPTFDALALVPFNVNPHYLDPDPGSKHMGETRETRIREFHEMNDAVVVGLREGAWLRREGGSLTLGGGANARIFRKGEEPEEKSPGSRLDFLLAE